MVRATLEKLCRHATINAAHPDALAPVVACLVKRLI
jgi:hypothetical protein